MAEESRIIINFIVKEKSENLDKLNIHSHIKKTEILDIKKKLIKLVGESMRNLSVTCHHNQL